MDATEARDHIEMVDRILQQAEPLRFRPWATLLIAFGIAAALLDAGVQMHADKNGTWPWATGAGAVLMLSAYAYAIGASILERRRAVRVSKVEAENGRIIGAVWLCIIIASFAQPHLLAGWAGSAIWSIGAAIQMTIIGFSGDRRALASAGVLLLSIVGANYVAQSGYVLAAGFILGYAAPGILYALEGARDSSARG